MKCGICNSVSFKFLYGIKDIKHSTIDSEFDLFHCNKCKVKLVVKDHKIVETSNYYPQEYKAYDSIKIRKNNDKVFPLNVVKGRLAWAKHLDIKPISKILDIGSGNGANMLFLRNNYDVELTGIEPNHIAANIGKKQGLNIHIGYLDDFSAKEKFDIIYLTHVIEHLKDPVYSLKKINKMLKNGGKLVVCTPNTSSLERHLFRKYWDGWDTPRHIYMFNEKSIKIALNRADFKDIKIYYEIYSIFKRSYTNIYKSKGKKINSKITNKILSGIDLTLSYVLPNFKSSSAFQIIATK